MVLKLGYDHTVKLCVALFFYPILCIIDIYFVQVSLDPPLKQGQTRYHFLILLFYKEDDLFVEMALDE